MSEKKRDVPKHLHSPDEILGSLEQPGFLQPPLGDQTFYGNIKIAGTNDPYKFVVLDEDDNILFQINTETGEIITYGDQTISGKLEIPSDAPRMTKQQISEAIWFYENSTWAPKGFPAVTNKLRFKDNLTGHYLDMFVIISAEDGGDEDPLLVIDQGAVFKKDGAFGGFLSTGEGVLAVGHGMGSVTKPPFMWMFHSELGFDRYYFYKFDRETLANIAVADIECNTINGQPPSGGIQSGSDITDANGDKTVTFDEAFDEIPKISVTPFDASGRAISIVFTAKSTTQFTVKAKLLETHKHKIGQAAATADWTMSIANDGEHYHGFGMEHGGAAVDIAHDHGTHRHGFPPGAAAVDIAHVHTLGETLKEVGGTTGSESSHTHSWGDSFTTGVPSSTTSVSLIALGDCPLGHSNCEITQHNIRTPASSAHSHSGSVSGTTGGGSSHTHGFPGTAAVDIAHSHTLGETLKEVGGYTGYAGVSLGETIKNVGGNTGDAGIHNHAFQNKAPYARGINLRNEAGSVVEAGATMMTVTDTAVDLFTEASVLAGVVVNFDWMAIPA